MMNKHPVLKTASFILLTLALFLLLDAMTRQVLQPFFIRSGRFWLNDFELTERAHPEKVWDKVFYGNSVVIAAYREEESNSGYVNLGIDDGTLVDLWEMLDGAHVRIGSDLVLGLNELTIYDDFPTNPGYIWHKAPFEPYCYFARTRLQKLALDTAKQLLRVEQPSFAYAGQEKSYYYGSVSQAELDAKLASEGYAKYLSLTSSDFDANFEALEKIADRCEKDGVRLRLVFMPVSPAAGQSQSRENAFARLKTFCDSRSLELYDLRDDFDAECFYDIGHMNREYGSHRFTKEIEPWLNS